MLRNYFKIAIAVLARRKFFTFISLFGISFTLAILMVLTSFKDFLLSPTYPEVKRNESLYINRVVEQNSKFFYTMNSEPSYTFLEKYVLPLKTADKVAISSYARPANVFMKDQRLDFHIRYTNEDFWNVLSFRFLEGKPFTQQEIQNSDKVAVITEKAKKEYFGEETPVVGKFIQANNINYRVEGVVKDVPLTNLYSYAEIYVPYTTTNSNYKSSSYQGDYTAILVPKKGVESSEMETEFQQVMARVKPEDPKNFNQIFCHADKYTESFTRAITGNHNNKSGIQILYIAIGIFVFLFMLLPTINLVNINISRIMERSSEIGVRKAYGASSRTLVLQFIFENMILTLLGGLIGVVIAGMVIHFINSSDLVPNADLSLNLRVLFYSLLLCLLFGFFSGVLPAWRMSRLHVINALKTNG